MPLPPFVTRSKIDPRKLPAAPSIRPEKEWSALHPNLWVAGIDEAGRGPLAGPVIAAAVVFSFNQKRPVGINDSKKLTHQERVRLSMLIKNSALAWGIGHAEPWEIDQHNILAATKIAATRAVHQANNRLNGFIPGPQIGALVTDALDLPDYPCPQLALIKGDQRSISVAAASILAKVERDQLLLKHSREFPDYGWASNKGYPTKDHCKALELHGPCSWHRFSYKPVALQPKPLVRSISCQKLEQQFLETSPVDVKEISNLALLLKKAAETLIAEDHRYLTNLFASRFSEFVKKNTNFSLESTINP